MKWTVTLVCLILMGCATPQKVRVVHHYHHTAPRKITAEGDDAAVKALIKSLRE